MNKNKHEFDTEPLTPTQRAEVLLQKAESQFDRLSAGLLDNIGPAEGVTLGYYLICDTDPHKPKPPVLVSDGDLGDMAERFGGRTLRLVSIHRNLVGQCDFQTQLKPTKVDTYVQQLEDGNFDLAMPDIILIPSAEGPIINGYPVDMVHAMDGSDSNLDSTLTRLEQIMFQVEEASTIRPKTHPAT